jgi:hypothetical protein
MKPSLSERPNQALDRNCLSSGIAVRLEACLERFTDKRLHQLIILWVEAFTPSWVYSQGEKLTIQFINSLRDGALRKMRATDLEGESIGGDLRVV